MSSTYVPEETIPYVVHHLRRVTEIFKVAASHWKVVETLTPQDFLEFRSGLGTASGFQSFQMREMETLLGLEKEEREKFGHTSPLDILKGYVKGGKSYESSIGERLEGVEKEQSFRKALHNWLYRTPINGSMPDDPDDIKVVDEFIDEYMLLQEKSIEGHIQALVAEQGQSYEPIARAKYGPSLKAGKDFFHALDVPEITLADPQHRRKTKRIRVSVLFIESYRTLPLLAWPRLLLDTVAELEEQLVLFRTYHARMVERVIGRRVGTGGSSGVEYLDGTTKYRVFPELWLVRTMLLPVGQLPKLKEHTVYKFAKEFQ